VRELAIKLHILKDFKDLKFNDRNDFRELYVIYFKENPVYVGISERLIKRVNSHIKGDNYRTSAFAYQVAKKRYLKDNNGNFINPKSGKDYTRKEFYELKLVASARAEVTKMKIRILPIQDEIQLYLFEVYCAMKLKTAFNSFDTH